MGLRDESKKTFTTTHCPTLNEINTGSLQRIADASELMAKDRQRLVGERDRYKRWGEAVSEERERMTRSNAALRGQITKLNKRLAAVSNG